MHKQRRSQGSYKMPEKKAIIILAQLPVMCTKMHMLYKVSKLKIPGLLALETEHILSTGGLKSCSINHKFGTKMDSRQLIKDLR